MIKFQKRASDVALTLLLMVIFIPIMLITAIFIGFVMGFPIFFFQQRPGLHGKPFRLYKFRTMKEELDKDGEPTPDKQRLLKLGKFLRSTSLDELPSLWNVLRGDMSLVGTRPLLMEYLPLYTEEQARRHEVKPGITGWAQVNGRNAIGWEEKFKLDVWYVDNQSFWLDMKILLLTVKKVLVRDGISEKGHVTIEPFRGGEK